MRRKCGRNLILFRSAFLLAAFLLCRPLIAQDTLRADTVEAGVIVVRRPPIPAIYGVRLQYMYTQQAVRKSRQANVERTAIVFSDSMKNIVPPQPFFYSRDSIRNPEIIMALRDANYFADSLVWPNFYSTLGYSFSRSDTSRIDSACFRIVVKRSGEFTVTPLPWQRADSVCRSFEKLAYSKVNRYIYWSPAFAKTKKQKKRKRKQVESIIILTIYARDPTYGKFMPIENKVR